MLSSVRRFSRASRSALEVFLFFYGLAGHHIDFSGTPILGTATRYMGPSHEGSRRDLDTSQQLETKGSL
jgi:hypothetical protein